MGKRDKNLALILVLSMVFSSLSLIVAIKPANAQTAPTPSAPTFTVQVKAYTIYPESTVTINPFTGQNETVYNGYTYEQMIAEFTIKNQPYPQYDYSGNPIQIYYNFRLKGHFESVWSNTAGPSPHYDPSSTCYYPFYYTSAFPNGITVGYAFTYNSLQYYAASNSNYTVISIDLLNFTNTPVPDDPFPNNSQVDFQVQAIGGYLNPYSNGAILYGSFYYFNGTTSDWSNTQTVTINYNSNSTSTSPTSTSTPTSSVPEFPSLIILSFLSASLVAGTVLAMRRRKVSYQKNSQGFFIKI